MKKLHLLLLATTLICGSILNAAEPESVYIVRDAWLDRLFTFHPTTPPGILLRERPSSSSIIESLFTAIIKDDLKKVTTLIDVQKIDVNAYLNTTNITALHLAAAYSKLSIAEFLLNHGAHSNALDTNNETPLHMLARRFHLHEPPMVLMLQLLLNYGADLTLKNKYGQLPYLYVKSGKETPLLLAAQRIDAYEESDEDTALLPNRRERMNPDSNLSHMILSKYKEYYI